VKISSVVRKLNGGHTHGQHGDLTSPLGKESGIKMDAGI